MSCSRNNCRCEFKEIEDNIDSASWEAFKLSLKSSALLTVADTADVGVILAEPFVETLDLPSKLSLSFTWRYFGKPLLSCNIKFSNTLLIGVVLVSKSLVLNL